jgi:signal transduction histidine kinase
VLRALALFSRRAGESKTPQEIWSLLADAIAQEAGAEGVGLLQVLESGNIQLVANRNLEIEEWETPADTVGPELGEQLRIADGSEFRSTTLFPLVSRGDLLGAIVLFAKGESVSESTLELAQTLGDIAATALGGAYQLETLRRSYVELRASRDLLARSEKLRSLGEMAASISHDLKSILNGLSLPLQALRRELSADAEIAEILQSAELTVKRGIDTVERLRSFSRQAPDTRVEPVQIDEVLQEAIDLARPAITSAAHRPEVELTLGSPPPVLVHASELVAAVMNLVINAVEALDKPGMVRVETFSREGQAVIRVSDTGPGIPIELQERIFEPFFTTKGARGTGLGLAMVYAFVRRYRGTITFESAPGRGTTFTITFPPATP